MMQAGEFTTCLKSRKSCPLFHTLSSSVCDAILGSVNQGCSSTSGLTDLAFPDGISLLGDSFLALQETVNQVHTVLQLWVCASKTEALSVYVNPPLHQVIDVADERSEEVSSFKYHGAFFTSVCQAFGEIKLHFGWTRTAFNRLQSSLLSRPKILCRTKGRIYESVIETSLLYGCATLLLRVEEHLIALQLFEMNLA